MKMTTYGLGGYDPSLPNNNIIEVIELLDESQSPLDPTGALATLLAVTEVVSVQDAANAVRLSVAELEAEANAWAAARDMNLGN